MKSLNIALTALHHARIPFATRELLVKGALCFSLLVSQLLPGCASPQKMKMGQGDGSICSSPKALICKMNSALHRGDYEMLASCMVPDHQDEFTEVLARSKAYTDKVAALVEVIRKQIRPEEACKYKERVFMGMLTSPFGRCTEEARIDWGRVTIVKEEGTARVLVDDPKGRDFRLMHSGQGWFLAPSYYLDGLPEEGTAWYASVFDEFGRQADTLHRQILQGKIDHGNFAEIILSGS